MAVSALVVTAGCGGSEGSGSSNDTEPLTQEQATAALLTLDNLGKGYRKASGDDSAADMEDMGCLSQLDKLDKAEAATKAEADFEHTGGLGTPAVTTQVSSFEQTGDLIGTMDEFRDTLADCTQVEFSEDGATMTLDLTTDEEKSTSDVDDQINVHGTGTVSAEGLELPMGMSFALARVDNHLTLVGVVDLGDAGARLLDTYTEIAVDRLVAIAADEEPPSVTADVDAGTDPGEEEPSAEPFQQLPLDGGTYTWSNGITLALSVERVEKWGTTDDFCGDGSCGVANPEDTRFVLKYEVSVPEDYPEPFDPSGCPGQLHSTSGSDDEALSGVAGDYYRDLGGKIFPGGSKFGVNEYYIEKAYADGEFYIESSCGDADYSGESAYFVGPIADVN